MCNDDDDNGDKYRNKTLDFWSILPANVYRFSNFFSLTDGRVNILCNCNIDFHYALTVLVHYLAKFKNSTLPLW